MIRPTTAALRGRQRTECEVMHSGASREAASAFTSDSSIAVVVRVMKAVTD